MQLTQLIFAKQTSLDTLFCNSYQNVSYHDLNSHPSGKRDFSINTTESK